MKQHLFILLFLTGVVPCLQSVSRKYFLVLQGGTWTDAQAYCRANYDDLATIKDWDDLAEIQTEAEKQQFVSYAWIGLYTNVNAWHWSLGNQSLGTMTDWYPVVPWQEPNNANGYEECCAFNPQGWFDRSCWEKFAFVCYDDRNIGTEKYIYYSTLLTWSDARSYCRQHHTDLTSSRDATENSILMGKIPHTSAFNWFGLFRNSWMWSDGTNSTFIVWATNQPKGNENCVSIYDTKATSAPCSDVKPFFCHSVLHPRKQQIIRVKVRSSQDVHHSAVMVDILEKIQQKMKDHGVAMNITLKWRDNSDGVVFHKEKEDTSSGV